MEDKEDFVVYVVKLNPHNTLGDMQPLVEDLYHRENLVELERKIYIIYI